MPTYDAQLFLAGAYVDGDTDDVVSLNSPVTGEHLADLPVPSRGQVDTAVAAARNGVRRLPALVSATSEPSSATASPTSSRPTPTSWPGSPPSSRASRSTPRHASDVDDTASLFRGLGRGRQAPLRRDHPEHRARQAHVHVPRTGRCVGRHHAVELPADDHAAEFLGPALATGNASSASPRRSRRSPAWRWASCSTEAGVPDGLVSILPGRRRGR